jgi:hypothetical protein
MARTLNPVDTDTIHTNTLRAQRMLQCHTLVNHQYIVLLQELQNRHRITCRLDNLDPFLNSNLRVGHVIRLDDSGEKSDVHAEGLGGHSASFADLSAKELGRGLRQSGEEAEAASVGDGADELRFADPHHAALHDGLFDADRLREPGFDGHDCGGVMSGLLEELVTA